MTDSRVELRVLGDLAVMSDDVPRRLGGPNTRQLLAVLVANAGRAVSCDRLVDSLWPDRPPKSAVATVRAQISRLRSLLQPGFTIELLPAGYELVTVDGDVDARRFEELVADSATLQPGDRAAVLAVALGSWHGRAFGGFADHPEIRSEAARLDELRLVATERWAAARLATGDAAEMVGELESLVIEFPLREACWRLLMLSLHRSGRRAEALRRAAEFRSALAEETGLAPSSVLLELESQILNDDPRLGVLSQPSSGRSGNRVARQLLGVTEFVGRNDAIVVLESAITHQRLVTITGPGGVGKTRLATRLAGTICDRFVDGVTVVELASQRDLAGAARAIAHALDIQPYQFQTIDSTVEEHLTAAQMLLVLDNCEHLLDALAPIVDRLRSVCPELRILATSREPLGLAGEYVHVLGPLEVPQRSATTADKRRSDVVVLFVDRAATATPDFVLTDDDVDLVVEICERLDGLPLALELATARLRTMGLRTLARRLNERTELTGQTQRGADERHRTLHHLVEWSYDLLSTAEKTVFEQVSIFAGGFDLAAAEAVCSVDDQVRSIISHLFGLVDKSMVVMVDPTRPRYRVLEPLREFGLERLRQHGQVAAAEDRHLEWFLGLALGGAVGLDSPDESMWSDDLDREFANFRAAHLTAVRRTDAARALALVSALSEFAIRRVQYEITNWAEASARLPGANHEADLPIALGLAAYGHFVRGDMENAVDLARRATETERNMDGAGSGLPERVLGNALFYLECTDEAIGWIRLMVTAARHSDRPARIAHALYMHSVAATSTGDSARGATLADEAWEAARRAGSPTALAHANYARGLAIESVDPHGSLEHLVRSSELAAGAGNRWVEAFALTEVYWLQARRGDQLRALRGYAVVIDLWYRGGDWANQWLSLRRVLGMLLELRLYEPAAVLHGALTAVGASHALPFEPADAESLAKNVAALRVQLGTEPFAEAMQRGASMTDHEIVTFVKHEIAVLTMSDPDSPAGEVGRLGGAPPERRRGQPGPITRRT